MARIERRTGAGSPRSSPASGNTRGVPWAENRLVACRLRPAGPCKGDGLPWPRLGRRRPQPASGNALVHLISSMHTLDRTAATPGSRISVSIRKRDSAGRSRATTFSM